jgi:hypothetical protein
VWAIKGTQLVRINPQFRDVSAEWKKDVEVTLESVWAVRGDRLLRIVPQFHDKGSDVKSGMTNQN